MGKKEERKFESLHQLIQLLLDHPEGLTKAEIARRLNVHRSTAGQYIDDLGAPGGFNIPVFEVSPDRFTIDRDHYEVKVSVDIHEALALHLATRLLTTRTDKYNPHAASALRKLGRALEKLAPLISDHMHRSAEVLDAADRRRDPIFLQALETLTRAWSRQRKVRLTHEMDDGSIHEYVFSPYYIEPYAVGRTMHAIGYREPPGKIRTFKIERIRTIKLLEDAAYTIPATFDLLAQLRDAWGIWYTERSAEPVKLHFTRRVAKRVQETLWHHTQEISEQPDGSIVWTAQVAEWQEMLPWVRGWGGEVEAIEPEGLREALIREARNLIQLYQTEDTLQLQDAALDLNHCSFYAHSKQGLDKAEWQCLKEHLVNTADLAAGFGRNAGVAELARVAGLMHDIGKYSTAFQKRLEGSKHKVDHSTAGAREIIGLFKDTPQKILADMLAYCIAGHHTGLPDYGSKADVEGDGTLLARVDKAKLEDYSAYKADIDPGTLALPERLSIRPAKNCRGKPITGFTMSFLTRMVFSALVDADFQETEAYMGGGTKPRGEYASITELRDKFTHFLQAFDNPVGEINRKRTETLQACIDRSSAAPGFFTLTVPTGGGKTLSSMAFALNHAVAHGLERIIYVIPFTTIIEQNAAVFKQSLGEENVLEHHSNFDWEQKRNMAGETADDLTSNAITKLKLAAENWDIPVVVTTNVQFFESLFANRSSRCRKLHNLAKSVIVFDEAQMLPREYLEPCLYAVQELVQNYGSSAVFCTATQPSLKRFLAPDVQLTELAPDPQSLFDSYRRVRVKNKGKLTDEGLLEELRAHPQVLCIVNTRRHAKGLFDGLASLTNEGCFHLSTLMCPAHRKEALATIRELLVNDEPCRVVSTQVMEAGIDVDFPIGYRAMAGLDSIIQAAGRVNREGKQAMGEIYAFEPETPYIKRIPAFVGQGAAVSTSILHQFGDDPVTVEAIDAYFRLLYTLQGDGAFDAKGIVNCFESQGVSFNFKTAAERFRLIDNDTVSVIVPYNEEAKQLIDELKAPHYTPYLATLLRKLQRNLQMYTVNIYEFEFGKLQSKGAIETCHERFHILSNTDFYSEQTGLVIPAEAGGDAIFIDV